MARLKGSKKGSTPSAARPPEQPLLEVQYHPADIRRGVRYFFLSRRQISLWGLGLAAYATFLLFSLAISPAMVRNLLAERQYGVELDKQALLGERLQDLLGRLDAVGGETERVRLEMSKIYLAYGFDYQEAKGKGGYPFPVEVDPDSVFGEEIHEGNVQRAKIAEQLAVLGTFLDEVQSFESAHREQVRTTPSISPLASGSFVLTSPFGQRISPFTNAADFHAGIDLAAPVGTPIYAPASGVVSFAGRFSLKRSVSWWRYGNLVAISHGDRFITLFGHCDEVKVRTGQKVEQGQEIATVGDTGWSTSPHLHYEIRRKEDGGELRPVDPRIYILDHRWRNEELLLVRARRAPDASNYEPLPRLIAR